MSKLDKTMGRTRARDRRKDDSAKVPHKPRERTFTATIEWFESHSKSLTIEAVNQTELDHQVALKVMAIQAQPAHVKGGRLHLYDLKLWSAKTTGLKVSTPYVNRGEE